MCIASVSQENRLKDEGLLENPFENEGLLENPFENEGSLENPFENEGSLESPSFEDESSRVKDEPFTLTKLNALAKLIASSARAPETLLYAYSADKIVEGRGFNGLQEIATQLFRQGVKDRALDLNAFGHKSKKYFRVVCRKRGYASTFDIITTSDIKSLIMRDVDNDESLNQSASRFELANFLVRALCMSTSELISQVIDTLTVAEINAVFGFMKSRKYLSVQSSMNFILKLRQEFLINEIKVRGLFLSDRTGAVDTEQKEKVDNVILELHKNHGKEAFYMNTDSLARTLNKLIQQQQQQPEVKEEISHDQKHRNWQNAVCQYGLEKTLRALTYVHNPQYIKEMMQEGAKELSLDPGRLTFYQQLRESGVHGKHKTKTITQEESLDLKLKIAEVCLRLIPAGRIAGLVFSRLSNDQLAGYIEQVLGYKINRNSWTKRTKDELLDELLKHWIDYQSCKAKPLMTC